MTAEDLPVTFHLTTPHGEVALWWVDLPAQSHDAQRQFVRRHIARILDRQFPSASLAQIHWPPGDMHPPDLAYAARSWGAPASTPSLWLSWSYLPAPGGGQPRHALLAVAPFPIGVDVSAASLLTLSAWADVLRLYGGMPQPPASAQECAMLWAGIEASDKCLRTGLREWSAQVATERRRCTLIPMPLPHPGLAAALAWMAPA